ncbi:MAG TPA: hypothetical protein VHT51_20330 [Micropepsaceae bacterium]|nr:hypothetical protein [Micropepsaceae bacterium]
MKVRGGGTSQARSRGFALIVVLWFLVLIAAIGTYLMVNARTETAIARNTRVAATAEALADAGIAQAVFNLTDPVESNRWGLDGEPHRLQLTTGEMEIRLSDENSKINPNHASDALLSALFEAAGVERMRARRLGAAVADWVSDDMMPRPFGAKLEQYQQAGLSYGPPNAPIESLDELNLVLGMTPETFAAVRPYLTIYTDDEAPDPKNAPPVIQQALLLAARQTPEDAAGPPDPSQPVTSGADAAPANPNLSQNPDAPPPSPQPAPGAAQAIDPTMPGAMKSPQSIIGIDITAVSTAGGTFVRHAVVRLDSDNPKGYAVLDWQRGDLAATD